MKWFADEVNVIREIINTWSIWSMWMWNEEIYVIIYILTVMSWINIHKHQFFPKNRMICIQGHHMPQIHWCGQFVRRFIDGFDIKQWQSLSHWIEQDEANTVQQHLHKGRFKYLTGWCFPCTGAFDIQTQHSGIDSTHTQTDLFLPHTPTEILPLLISSVSSALPSSSPAVNVSWR